MNKKQDSRTKMLLLSCSQCVLLLLRCSELLNSERVGPLEQLRGKQAKYDHEPKRLRSEDSRVCLSPKLSYKPAAGSCSQTVPPERLRSPSESGSLRSRTGVTPRRPAAPCHPCSGPRGSESPQWGVWFGRSCVAAGRADGGGREGGRAGGAAPSSPGQPEWHPFAPQLRWARPGDFLGWGCGGRSKLAPPNGLSLSKQR